MELKNNCFIAVYTNQVKDYCDSKFFKNLKELAGDSIVSVIDNSTHTRYHKKLSQMFSKKTMNFRLKRLAIPSKPKSTQFQRNVCDSVNYLRDEFLRTNKEYFIIIESDVIPPTDLLEQFEQSIRDLENTKWGIIGGIYYEGFHRNDLKGLAATKHVLSGCTLYKREVIERFPFRWDVSLIGAFPDYWMSMDAGRHYWMFDDYRIQCSHEHTINKTRISKPL